MRLSLWFLTAFAVLLWVPGCGEDGSATEILDVRAPSLVRNVAAFPADQKVRVTWTPNNETDILGYNIYRSTSSEDGYTLVGSTGTQQSPFFQDEGEDFSGDGLPDGLTNQLRYFYKVTAFDREGRETSIDLASSVSAVPGVQPGSLEDLFVTNVRVYGGNERAIVTWDLSRDTSVYGYLVFRQTLGAPEGFQMAALIPQGRCFFSDGGLPNGSEFSYAVAPVTRDFFQGRLVESRAVRVDPGDSTRPKPPGSEASNGPLTVLEVGSSGVTLRWGRPTENTDGTLLFLPGGGEDQLVGGGFVVYRSKNAEGPFEPIGILEEIGSETSFTFTDPQGTSEHIYMVRAFDRLGTLSDDSRRISAGSQILPDVIRGVDAFAGVGFGTIQVTWNLEPTASSGARVYRSLFPDRGYEPVSGDLPVGQSFFTDAGPFEVATTYWYKVAGLAKDKRGEIVEGARSDPVPAVSGPSDGIFFLEAEDATIQGATAGAFQNVTRQGFPRPFTGRGALFVDMAPTAIPDGFTTFLEMDWQVEIDASGPLGTPGAYDVYFRYVPSRTAGIFDVRLQVANITGTGSVAQRNGFDFFREDPGFPPRVRNLFLGQISILDGDNVGGNPIREILRLRLGYQGFNPLISEGNGELFFDSIVLVRR